MQESDANGSRFPTIRHVWSDYSGPRKEILSEVDLALVHALQVDPRAPWARIAQVIGVDAATVARRWAAIAESRTAWFSVWPTPERHAGLSAAALVLVSGAVSDGDAEQWCALPWVLTVERTSMGLMALVVGHGGVPALDARIRDTFVRAGFDVRVEYAADVPREDSTWRLRVLSERQVEQVVSPPSSAAERSRAARDDVIEEVTALLREDARMALGAMAARMGVSDATARRTVERLVGQGLVRVGCDVAMPAVGLHCGAVLRVAGWESDEAARAVLNHPSVHRVMQTVGPVRATVSLRMASLAELSALEASWRGTDVADRWTVTLPLKRNGHLLGHDGRSTAQVEVDW